MLIQSSYCYCDSESRWQDGGCGLGGCKCEHLLT